MSDFVGETIRMPVSAVAPGSPSTGDLFYNSSLLKAQYWDGTQWISVPGSGGGGPATPSTFGEDVNVDDKAKPKTLVSEQIDVSDDYRPKPQLGEDVNVDDAYQAVTAQNWDEDVNMNDLARVQTATTQIGASGTPDTDPAGDTWIDQASAGTNHGTETTMLAKGNMTASSNERRAFLEIDFTQIVGFTAQATTPFTLRVTCLNSNAIIAVTLTWTATTNATRHFTESTATWTTQPAAGTALTSGTISVPTGAATVQTITLTQAQVNTCIGKFVMFKFTTATAAIPDTITINTREHATKWNYDLKLTRGT